MLKFYNSLGRSVQDFVPIDPNNVRMYVCGPTVYDYAHIGNARPVVVFDVLYRLLRYHYGTEHVTYVRNITDIDDKIIERAAQENIDINELTQYTTRAFQQDMTALGTLPPDHQPRATQAIPEMIVLIEQLLEKGYAYQAQEHVFFHVPAMKDYGRLSGRSLEEMLVGARVEAMDCKRNPMDFVLWKPSNSEQPGWESPWGRGRPGWHIECSAMARKFLGEHFDIHGGGIDLIFPHHENEIAQSCCAHGCDYVNFWLHNGFLQIEGQKMSKSLGNFVTVRQLLREQGIAGEVIRLVLLKTHYRHPLDWTKNAVDAAQATLDRWYKLLASEGCVSDDYKALPEIFWQALASDMNTPQVFAVMASLPVAQLLTAARFLGFLQMTPKDWLAQKQDLDIGMESWVAEMIEKRQTARKQRDFAQADAIRQALLEKNIVLEDTKDGTIWRKQ